MILRRCASLSSLPFLLALFAPGLSGCGGRALEVGGSVTDGGTSTTEDGATSKGTGSDKGCAPIPDEPMCFNGCTQQQVEVECKNGQWQCPPEPPCLPPPPPPGGDSDDAGTTTADATISSGVACGSTFCAGQTFCELVDFSSGTMMPSWKCEPLPAACQGDQTCGCLLQAHAYSCEAPAGPTCQEDGTGITMGCVAH